MLGALLIHRDKIFLLNCIWNFFYMKGWILVHQQIQWSIYELSPIHMGKTRYSLVYISFERNMSRKRNKNKWNASLKWVSMPLSQTLKPETEIYLELYSAWEGLAEPPICWNDIGESSCHPVSCCDHEWDRLTIKVRVWLPVGPPVAWHGCPSSSRTLNPYWPNWSSPSDVLYWNKLKVVSPIYCKPNTTMALAWYPRNPKHKTQLAITKTVFTWLIKMLEGYLWKRTGTIPAW